MKTNKQQSISRLQDGSIDYAHYLDIGRRERYRAIHSLGNRLAGMNPRPGILFMAFGLTLILPLAMG